MKRPGESSTRSTHSSSRAASRMSSRRNGAPMTSRIGSTKPLSSTSATGSVSRKSLPLGKETTDHGKPPVDRGEDREAEADGDRWPRGKRTAAGRRSSAPMVDPRPEDRDEVPDRREGRHGPEAVGTASSGGMEPTGGNRA